MHGDFGVRSRESDGDRNRVDRFGGMAYASRLVVTRVGVQPENVRRRHPGGAAPMEGAAREWWK